VSASGRPIRFLAVVLGGWTAMRVAMLWPSIDSPADVIDAVVPGLNRRTSAVVSPKKELPAAGRTVAIPPSPESATPSITSPLAHARRPDPQRIALAMFGLMRFGEAEPVLATGGTAPVGSLPLAPRANTGSRWSGSGWFVVRDGHKTGAAFGGSQLGGSQAGLRLAYTIDRAHRLAIAGRLSTPLAGKGREAAIGLEWQPMPLPVRIVAEERISLDGGEGGPTLGVIGGVGPIAVAAETTIEAYGQAGAIVRDGVETFADGAVRVALYSRTLDATRVDFGAGAWGAAQRNAARLDTGPSLSADVPIGRVHARLSVDWRARIAGDARPGSGLVLSLGTDF